MWYIHSYSYRNDIIPVGIYLHPYLQSNVAGMGLPDQLTRLHRKKKLPTTRVMKPVRFRLYNYWLLLRMLCMRDKRISFAVLRYILCLLARNE
ncbi:MAG: hypothetical protein J7623_07410 [Chitinophaga sp.]|uniref:hypothetical protein n=1 Tax=Chitinophaga sp. TaxID=1869181 RepID=UPI001B2240FB|nr:hypothetical protein [Chitinophaga sp.]MBO9728452.1 hypothetical protein [Chitinophaga sp.]